MHHRLAKEFARIEANYPNPLSEEEIYEYLKDFSKIVPQGSPMSGIGHPFVTQSVSNCCVIDGPEDNISSIADTSKELANLYKNRFGVGFDLSKLRPQGAAVNNSAKASTGAWSFAEWYSTVTNIIGQNARRGALMLTLSIKHPDALHFSKMKLDESKVTGANVSLRITDEFMAAVENNSTFIQQWPIDSQEPKVTQVINARELWDEIVDCAQKRGDPGLLMWDNITRNLPSEFYKGFESLSTNPSLRGDTKVWSALLDPNLHSLERQALRPIKDLVDKSFMVRNINGELAHAICFVSGRGKQLYKISFEGNYMQDIYCTAEHKWPIWLKADHYTKIETKNLTPGCKFLRMPIEHSYIGPSLPSLITVKSIEATDIYEDVYDITVQDDTHTFQLEHCITGNCSEIPMCVDTCRLITQNLLGFVSNHFTKKAVFDAEAFRRSTQVAMRLSDDLVDIEIEQLQKLIAKYESEDDLSSAKSMTRLLDNARAARRTGLGLHALGDTLASLGIQYDSPEGIAFTEEIYRLHAAVAYETSITLGKERGIPSIFNDGLKDSDCEFLQRLEASGLVKAIGIPRRNAAILTTAPTGTVALLSAARLFKLGLGGTSSGIESILWLSCDRYKKHPHTSTEKPDRVDQMGVRWKRFDCLHPAHQYWLSLPKEDRVDESVFRTVKDIDPLIKVELVAAAQRWVDHGISCTINCPKGTTKEQVHNIYLHAWKSGMKGITVYVDGSRQTAVLETKGIKEHHAPKRPKELPCDIHRRKIDGEYWTVLVGIYEDRPYEIFAGKSDDISIGASIKNGTLIKSKKDGKSQYDLHFLVRGKEQSIQDIVSVFDNKLYADQSRLASMSLRHGVPLEFIAEQLGKAASDSDDEEYQMDKFSLVTARVIKSYIPDGTKALSNTTCKDCGNNSMLFQDGCYKCSACGSGRCS